MYIDKNKGLKMITIYQIKEEIFNKLNGNNELYLKYSDVRHRANFKPKTFTAEDFTYYEPVYEVDVNDLEKAWEVTNHWQNPELIKRYRPGTSSSTSDIFKMNGEYYAVASCGFNKININ